MARATRLTMRQWPARRERNTVTEFRDLGVSEGTLKSLTTMGFEEPTPIQAQAIPLLLAGRDLIAQALTGTGKTAAFGVPIVERIAAGGRRPQVIVLTPTRELAVQVTDQLCKIGHERQIAVLPIYGGQPIGRQLQALRRGVQVVVATPGRLLDHLRRGSIDLGAIHTLVLDEADQMLEMGFIEDVATILEQLPSARVTALFSATMPKPIVDLARRYLREPEMIRLVRPQGLSVPDIDQVFYLVPFPRKLDALCRVLDARQPERAIVFCATKRMVDEVVEGLTARGYQAEALHGDISQAMRERVLRAFRNGQNEVLVATDVAARGLDVPEVSHVINFDIPPDPEYYVHRIGRTGRYGRRGEAITFVNPREMRVLKIIERVTGARIRREEVPTAAEAEERELEILGARLTAALGKGGWGRYRPLIEEMLLEDHDPVDLAAAALHLVASGMVGTRRVTSAKSAAAPASIPAPAAAPEPVRERPPFRRKDGQEERLPRREGDDRRPSRDGDNHRAKSAGPWKPKRQVSFGKLGSKPGSKLPGGKFVPRSSRNTATGPARPPRPKRPS
jgi:ATP-dependent RNA helicase DeaD